jgi:hypothetical protein
MARIRLLNFLLLAHIVGKIRKTVERIEDGLLSPVSDERKFHAIDAPWGSETTAEDERNSIAFSSNRDDVAVEVHVLAKSITEGTTRANEITMSVSRDECVEDSDRCTYLKSEDGRSIVIARTQKHDLAHLMKPKHGDVKVRSRELGAYNTN